MEILVTGATGTVGGHVLANVLGHDHVIKVLVRDRAKAQFTDVVEVIEGDLTGADDLRGTLAAWRRGQRGRPRCFAVLWAVRSAAPSIAG
jgi:nucleoside-diphosphate-sugar epimerase